MRSAGAQNSAGRVVYLHGFASSPGSLKARRFARALAARGITCQIPDLNEGCFRELTISRQLALLARLTRDEPPASVVLVGSSLGGYTAALFAARQAVVAGLVLMAPAFDFARRWSDRLGATALASWRERGHELVQHSGTGTDEPINYALMEDAERHPSYPTVSVPALVFHGRRDEVVAPEVSAVFAERCSRASVVWLDDDHGLASSIDTIVEGSLDFIAPLVGAQI